MDNRLIWITGVAYTIMVLFLFTLTIAAFRRIKRERIAIEKRTITFLTPQEVSEAIAEWAKSQGIDVDPDNVKICKDRYRYHGFWLLKKE